MNLGSQYKTYFARKYDTRLPSAKRMDSSIRKRSIVGNKDEKLEKARQRKEQRRRAIFINTIKPVSNTASGNTSVTRMKKAHTSSIVPNTAHKKEEVSNEKPKELRRNRSIRERYNHKGLYEQFLHKGHKRNQKSLVTADDDSTSTTHNKNVSLDKVGRNERSRIGNHKHTQSFIKLDLESKIENANKSISKLAEIRQKRDSLRVKPRIIQTNTIVLENRVGQRSVK